MAIKHTATFDGHTFKRTSENREYSHAVIVATSIEKRRAVIEASARRGWNTNRAHYQAYADGTSRFLVRKEWHKDDAAFKAQCDEDIAKANAWLALGEEGHAAKAVEQFDEAMKNALISSDGKYYYGCAGWCGRWDLADKLANRSAYQGKAHIVEALRS